MAESDKTAIDQHLPLDREVKLKLNIHEKGDTKISSSHIKKLLNSCDAKDRKKLNSIIKSIVQEGDIEALELVVECGYKVNILSNNGQTPLHLAFYNCSSYKIERKLVDLLFGCAGEQNFRDSMGLTHLHVACVFGNSNMVKKFIQNKENINTCYRYQLTALHFAVMNKNLEIVQLLVKNGANVSAKDHLGRTALHLAARVIDDEQKSYCGNDDLEILKFLLDHQFNIHLKDKDGNTPLLSIFQHFYPDHEEPFIWKCSSHEPSFDIDEDNAIKDITARQNDKLKILLKAGANITGGNKAGDTILHQIIIRTAFMRTPTDLRDVCFDDTQHAEMVKTILSVQQNFNINAENQKGETPLQVAVACLSAKIVKILLEHGANKQYLRLDYFHYVMVPNLECVQNLIAITELLKKDGFKMTILNELPVLKFLVHNRDDCRCGLNNTLDEHFDIRDHLNVLVHFGSSTHIKNIFKKVFRKSVMDTSYGMEPLLMDVLGYWNYIEFGNFFIEKKLHGVLVKTLRKSNFCMLPFKPDKKEIEKMKDTKLRSCLTLYEIMQKNPIHVYRYIKNEDFAFINNFPEYQAIIKGHLTKALIRNHVETTSYVYLKTIIVNPMPRSCLKNIMKFLDNEDMVNVVNAVLLSMMELLK